MTTTRVDNSTSGRTGIVRFGRPAPAPAPAPAPPAPAAAPTSRRPAEPERAAAAPRSTTRQPEVARREPARAAAAPRSTTRQPREPERAVAAPRSTTRQVRRPPPPPSDYVPTTARDLPMRSFLSAVGVIGLAVGSAALLGAQAHRPALAPVAWVQPVAAQSVAPAVTAAPAAERDYRADPLHLPVTVDPTTRVVVIGAEHATQVDDEAADEAPAARVQSGADVLRVPPERLDEVIRVIGRDEGHRRYWLELVDGRVIDVDLETADAVQRAMPLRSSYSRE